MSDAECSEGCEVEVTGHYSIKLVGGVDDGEEISIPAINGVLPTAWVRVGENYYDLVGKTEGKDYYEYALRKASNE